MHTNLTGVSLFILTALYSRQIDKATALTDEQRADVLYETVGTLMFTDEQKADLYARLAEQLNADTPREEAVKIIQRAIHACQYPG